MKSIRDKCIDFLKNEDTKRDVKEIIKPIVHIIYNEIYVYLWLLCFYHIFFIFIVLANLFLLLKLLAMNKKVIHFE
jgi:hypothetical protein